MSTLISEDGPAQPRWEVTAIDDARWCIHDGACRANDADSLVAYVERDALGLHDVLWLRSPCPARTRYRDIADVVADLDVVAGGAAAPRPRRSEAPTRIAHLSPWE